MACGSPGATAQRLRQVSVTVNSCRARRFRPWRLRQLIEARDDSVYSGIRQEGLASREAFCVRGTDTRRLLDPLDLDRSVARALADPQSLLARTRGRRNDGLPR